MSNLVSHAYLIKMEVHVREEIYEQDYPSNLQANKKRSLITYEQEQKGHSAQNILLVVCSI